MLKNRTHENFNRPGYEDTGPHREMAIDCPVNFVGSKKEPPRYPRPLSIVHGQSSPSGGTNAFPKNKSSVKEVPSRMSIEEEMNQQNRMKKYREDIQKRKEQEEKLQREQEFLRTSLRGSKKLQELKEPRNKPSPNSTGFVNPNYISEEEFAARKRKRNMVGSHLEVDDIVASVNHVQKYLDEPEDREELGIISRFVLGEKFQQLLKVHNKVVEVKLSGVDLSGSSSARDACTAVLENISASNHYAARELSFLLDQSTFRNVILAHDKIVKFRSEDPLKAIMSEAEEKEYLSKRASHYGDISIKVVKINKSSEPLGATVKNDGESVLISRIVKGSMADQSGLLHEGDEILEINENGVRGKTINDVSEFMSGLNGQLTFLIHPNENYRPTKVSNEPSIHLRALFNYEPDEDNYIPCRELGFSFMKGDVLHVIDTRDANWWQAYREGEEDQPLAGLVPSPSYQMQREELKQLIIGDMKENRKNQKRCHCVSRKKSNLNQMSFDSETKEYLTYEEVALYYPQPNRKRPIVLIGPKDVGRQELRQRLMKSDLDRFAAAVPHTSRPQRLEEIDHQDYHFISKQEFELEILKNNFVEYGIFEKHYFGTSMEAIRKVVNSGKICILNLYPQALKVLKASDLKPFFIFIAPPNIESLKQFKAKQGTKFTDETLKAIIQETREIEDRFGHYFDEVIIITDIDRAYEELLSVINRLEVQPQWVPMSWLT